MANLYVFVDECGLPSHDEYFAVAGCWCVSDLGPAPTLNETRINLRNLMADLGEIPSDQSELKGADLSPDGLDTLFSCLTQMGNEDNTISEPPYPWPSSSQPIRFTYGEVDAGIGRDVFSDFGHDLDTPQLLQSMMLLTVLRPLLYESSLDQTKYRQVRVVLDSPTWENAKEAVSDTDRTSEFEFEICDSKKAPGIQFADLAARVRRMRRLSESYESADEKLSELELE